jgi:uroporphyrinogen-III synthase
MSGTPLSGKHIAITRPIDQANKLRTMIEQASGTALLFPLIEIAPLDDYGNFDRVISQISEYDWAIFISSNAVQNGMPRLKQLHSLPDKLRFAAIGPVTAKELGEFGIASVLTPQGRYDSEALLELPEMHAMQGTKVMIFRGVGGRELLADTLRQRGATVTFAECYRRTNPQLDDELLATAYAQNKLDGIVVTSSEAMRHLLDLASNHDWLKNTPIFVNHARIAEAASALGLSIHVASGAGDDAMLQRLNTTLSVSDSRK